MQMTRFSVRFVSSDYSLVFHTEQQLSDFDIFRIVVINFVLCYKRSVCVYWKMFKPANEQMNQFLSKLLNRSCIVEVMIKKFGVFLCLTV